jgi:hypothetical protein
MSAVNSSNDTRNKNHRLGVHAKHAGVEHTSAEPLRHLGVGIDTGRYGHHVSFLREDKELAAPPLPITESREGYQKLQTRIELLHRRHPEAHIYLRIDAAGQYAANLEAFVRSLDHLPMTVSVGEPKRNKDYHRAHSPKRKQDASESLAMARYAVVERPQPSHGKPPQFAVLRRVAQKTGKVASTSLAILSPPARRSCAARATTWCVGCCGNVPSARRPRTEATRR